jgi:hypothetical protein
MNDPTAASAGLLRSLKRLLRPLVALALRGGITFPMLADVLRDLYVDVASREVLTDDAARTDSRLSLLTGIHRKEIRRQRIAGAEPPATTPAAVTLSAQIISRWLGQPPWMDEAGAPRPLPRVAPAGEPSFDALVAAVTTDVRGRAVLDEWLRQDIVRIDDGDRVALNVAAFIPPPGREEQLFYFARNLHDHIAAAAANIGADGKAPFMDRSVHYDALPPAAAAALEAVARDAAMRMLLDVNRGALELLAREPDAAAAAGPTRRVNLGIYLFFADEPEPGHDT